MTDLPSERSHYKQLLGRGDVLADIDRWLSAVGEASGWVVVEGSPGRGKTALLSHYLTMLESCGERVPHHFLRHGWGGSGRPEVLMRNLVRQLGQQYPEAVGSEPRSALRLHEVLQQVSDRQLVPRRQRLLLIIDGLDEAEAGRKKVWDEPGDEHPLRHVLPDVLPPRVQVLCSSRPAPNLAWLKALDGVHCIDLDSSQLADSNQEAVRLYWESMAKELRLDAAFIAEAVQRAEGNMLYTVKLAEWLKSAPAEHRRAELLPRGLKEFLQETWNRLQRISEPARKVVLDGLGYFAVASEALPLSVLGSIAGVEGREARQQLLGVAKPFLLEEADAWRGEPLLRLFHGSFRAFIQEKMGGEEVIRYHRELAERLCQWPERMPRNEFRRGYALRHAVTHWLEAGEVEQAVKLCTDVGYLQARCRERGVWGIEQDLARVIDQGGGDTVIMRALHRAVQAESHWLDKHPEALPRQLYNRLLASGWGASRIAKVLRLSPGDVPVLRLRHPIVMGGSEIRTLRGHVAPVNGCAVTGEGRGVSASADGTLRVWELETGRLLRSLPGYQAAVNGCAVTKDGRMAVSASADGVLRFWDLRTFESQGSLQGHEEAINGCAITPDGRFAISASEDGTLRVWDAGARVLLRTLEGHARPVNGCAVTADGGLVVSSSDDRSLKVWDLETGALLRTLQGHKGVVKGCAMTADGRRVVSSSADGTLKVWEPRTGRELLTLTGHKGWVKGCAVTPEGRWAISASDDKTLKVWDLESGQLRASFEGHEAWVKGCAVTADGSRALSASADGTLKVWNLDIDQSPMTVRCHEAAVHGCAVLADGSRAISASADGTLREWDLATGRELNTLRGHEAAVNGCAFIADGKQALSASDDRRLRVWDLKSRKTLQTLQGHKAWVNGCAVTADGRRAVSAAADGLLKVWDLKTGSELGTLRGHKDSVKSCVVTLDGRSAISASADGSLKVWDLKTGRDLATLKGHEAAVNSCAVTSDGRRVVSASADGTLKVWDLEVSREMGTLRGHEAPVNGCAVTPDGRQVVSASADCALKVWELQSGRCLHTFYGGSGFFTVSVARGVVCAGDALGNVWILEMDAVAEASEQGASHPLSARRRGSAFISYGTPDLSFAQKLDEALRAHGVRTFLASRDAVPGDEWAGVMQDGVNEYDRVILICSRASLDRKPVLYEIQETLKREARQGGGHCLIPIRLDDYVKKGWSPSIPRMARSIRDRVIADFEGTDSDPQKFQRSLLRVLEALEKPHH